MTNIIIIEDEAAAARHLQKLLQSYSEEFQLQAVLTSVREAANWLQQHPVPDLLFMDIRLSDGLAFEILEQCFIDSPIIFTTAYDEYALKAFRTTGIDYLLKPITPEELQIAVKKFQNLQENQLKDWFTKNLHALAELQAPVERKERFLLKKGNQLFPTRVENIAYFYRDELVFAVLFTGERFLLDTSLHQLQQVLAPDLFFRLNRSWLVNISAIQQLQTVKPGQVIVTLTPTIQSPVELSQKRSKLLKELLDR